MSFVCYVSFTLNMRVEAFLPAEGSMRHKMFAATLLPMIVLGLGIFAGSSASADDSEHLLTVDHYVAVHSTVPAISGQIAEIYVRERLQPGVALRSASLAGRVVLFVHGAGTPAEVAFDVPYQDYSWMGFLAQAGFDVFSMDETGYGRSTRPAAMNDPCNLSPAQQATFVPGLLSAPCAPSYPHQMTTIASDWNDINAAVDYVRALRHVERVSLVAWSLGGPRAGGYAAQHPEKVERLVLLAPASLFPAEYVKQRAANPPAELPASGSAMNTQSLAEFTANWDRQVGCEGQYDPAASDSVWSEMLKSDPVGATWGPGVRRAPEVTLWGANAETAAKIQAPILMVTGQYDKQVPSQNVRDFYAAAPAHRNVLIDLACSSHNAMWERNHLLLFRASLEWLTKGTALGKQEGMLRLGYAEGKQQGVN
jgi:pimeloyl-ACP methyl ester carboxylesterase